MDKNVDKNAVIELLNSLPDDFEIDFDDEDEGGQPNGIGEIEPSDYREWYSDARESHHRTRVIVTIYGPWEEGPTEGARRAQEREAAYAEKRRQAEEERILAKAAEILAARGQ